MIAFCGIECSECPTFKATQRDDDSERKKVARLWSKQFDSQIKPDEINCDGCMSEGGRLFSHCLVCKIRRCGQEKRIENCAHCDEFPCQNLSHVIDAIPDAKSRLEEIRGGR